MKGKFCVPTVAALALATPAWSASLTIQDTFNQGSNGSPMTDPSNSWANGRGCEGQIVSLHFE